MADARKYVLGDSGAEQLAINEVEIQGNTIKLITATGVIFQINGSDQPVFAAASIPSAADDAAAAALTPAVPIGGLYRTASALKIRVA